MKNEFKRFRILFLLIILVFFYILGSKFIHNIDSNVFFKIKSFIPNSVKHYVKNTIFIIPSLKKTINELNEIIVIQKKSLDRKDKTLKEIKNKFLGGSYPFISFHIEVKNKIIKSKHSKYLFTKFQTSYLDNGKNDNAAASAYIEEFNNKILLVNADGIFSYFYKNDLNQNKFDSIIIPTNIKEIIKYPEFYTKSKIGIKDILIDDDKLFISFSNKLPDDCFNTSILVANINFEYLNFNKFFYPTQCVKEDNDLGWINLHIAGGRMVNFKDNKILFSTGSFQYFKHPQDEASVFGKILSIDKTTSDWEIISKGHRNVQGLKYDHERNIIFFTEHGPMGGDEFNINFNPNLNDVENYGWPISSYGEHYTKDDKKDKLKYDAAPLYKSHEKYGFIEPIKYYVPSIGISEIEKIPKKFNKEFDNDFFISSMGNNQEEGDLSIHHIKLNKELKKILKEDIIVIGERIRDLKYIESLNKIILFIENSPGIGVLSYSGN